MKKLAAVLLLCLGSAFAQSAPSDLQHGSKEVEAFFQGGHSVAGGRGDTGIFSPGVRFGYVIGKVGSTSPLRGAFEYAVEGNLAVISQPGDNAYGVGFSPFTLKYNFTAGQRLTPFIELNGGVLFTNNNVPPGTNDVNFTSGATVGTHIPLGSGPKFVTIAAKYVHISNAGLTVPNPGVNTFQVRLGFGKWFGR